MSLPDIANLAPASRAAIERQVRAGMLRGYEDGNFHPFANLTREQAALLMDRLLFWSEAKAREYVKATLSIFNLTAGTGAGFFVWDKTNSLLRIATARHVVAQLYNINESMQIWTPYDRTHLYARSWWGPLRSDANDEKINILMSDNPAEEDLALLTITPPMRARLPAEVPWLPLGDDAPSVGAPVVCIGTPLNYDNTVTVGNVARAAFEVYHSAGEWCFVTAGINPGNSGGPVFDIENRVLGMALMKSWYKSAFGMGPADDLGWVQTARSIKAWAKRKWGIELA